MSLLLGDGVGAYARDKNTSARLCAKNAGGLMRRGAYLRDTTGILIATALTLNSLLTKRVSFCSSFITLYLLILVSLKLEFAIVIKTQFSLPVLYIDTAKQNLHCISYLASSPGPWEGPGDEAIS